MSSTGLFQVDGANKCIPPIPNHIKTTRNRRGGDYQAYTRAAMYIYSIHHFLILMLLEYPSILWYLLHLLLKYSVNLCIKSIILQQCFILNAIYL